MCDSIDRQHLRLTGLQFFCLPSGTLLNGSCFFRKAKLIKKKELEGVSDSDIEYGEIVFMLVMAFAVQAFPFRIEHVLSHPAFILRELRIPDLYTYIQTDDEKAEISANTGAG